jgi:hypothetical protein
MRCRNCAWFRRLRGRVPTTCRDVGEEADNEACSQFEIDEPEREPPDPKTAVGALLDQPYREIFHEILAENFVLEQDVRIAVDTIRAQLQAQGANIAIDTTYFERQADRLVRLYVLYRMTMAVGMQQYTERIIENEIERMFSEKERAGGKVVKR